MHGSACVQGVYVHMSSVFSSGNKQAVSQSSIAIPPKCTSGRALIWVKVLTA